MNQDSKDSIRARYREVDTSNVADVLDTLGYFDQGLHSDFAPYPADGGKLAGFAYTIRGQMTPYPQGGDAEKMQACQGIGAGEISVWSGDGEGICYFGELIALGMQERGSVGALVDGGIRDVRWIRECGYARDCSNADLHRDLEWVYEVFPKLRERRTQAAGTMSGGEQQMCAIGRGLMSKPKLLMIDELSLGLSPVMVDQLVADLKALSGEGLAIFLVEQDVATALELAEVAFVMDRGRIVRHGSAAELAADPAVQEAYIGSMG